MSKEFEELVLKKLEKLDVLDERTLNTDKVIQEVILPKLDKIDSLEEKTTNTDKIVQELSTELKNLNGKFTVFDFEINKKIDTLFDAFTVNRDKDLVHEKAFNHDIRISNLEDKVLTA